MAPAKKRRIARETMEVYVPIAHRLGLNDIYRELQDLAFSHLYPLRYRTLAKAVKAARGNRREVVKQDPRRGQEHAGRRRHPCRSLRPREDPVRHLQQDAQQAPVVLAGARRVRLPRGGRQRRPTATWRSAPCTRCTSRCPASSRTTSRFRKLNGYQSLHTTLIGPYGTPVEFQIRTQEMHRIAESRRGGALAVQERRRRT